MKILALILCYYLSFAFPSVAEQCGKQADGKLCPGGLCCSEYGYCGTTEAYCGEGCQSNCPGETPPSPSPPPPPPSPSGGGGEIGKLISKEMFEEMLLHRNGASNCALGFYTYEAFIEAANFFEGFGTTGDDETRKREIAAFFGQTSHETTGGWATAPDGPYTWGYCFNKEQGSPGPYCEPNPQWPCAPGKYYYGRGPIQIS